MQQTDEQTPKELSFLQIVQNILAAGLGVQSRVERQRAFSSKSPMPFIVGGIVFTSLFAGTLFVVVALVTR